MSQHVRQIAKDASVVGAATLLSRILGFFRDVAVAYVLGAGPAADAFYVAYRLPNTLRRLFAEGSMTMAFVPVFLDIREKKGDAAAFAMTRSALVWLLMILGVVTALAVAFARPLTLLIAPGFADDPGQLELTANLVRIVFPYIIQISVVALCMGALNSMGHFLAPALATSELNTVIIAGCGVAWLFGFDAPHALAWSVIVGGFGQMFMQHPALKRFGFSWIGPMKLMDEGVIRMARLMGPTVFGAAVYQVNILVGTLLASFLAAGSISALYYADRLVQFPLGVFGVAVGSVALPSLSRLAASGQMEEFKHTISASLRLTLFICLPATAGLMALAAPMVSVLFGRGAFTPVAEAATSAALLAYAAGLPAFACVRPLVSAFYALHDTRTPVRAGFYAMLANIGLGASLMLPLGQVGLALATSVSSWLNVWILARALSARQGAWADIGRTAWPSAGISVLIGLGAWLTPVNNYAALALIAVWAALYMGLAAAFKVEEAALLLEFVKKRIARRRAG
jgi:putative peptidoglycan lipid II flippase